MDNSGKGIIRASSRRELSAALREKRRTLDAVVAAARRRLEEKESKS